MAEWLETGLTTGLLLFVLVAYFASAEPAWRDLKSMTMLLLRGKETQSAPVANTR